MKVDPDGGRRPTVGMRDAPGTERDRGHNGGKHGGAECAERACSSAIATAIDHGAGIVTGTTAVLLSNETS